MLPRGRLVEAASLPCHARHAAAASRYRPGRAGAGSDAAKPGIAVQVEVSGLCATGIQVRGAGTPKYRTLMACSDYLSILPYYLSVLWARLREIGGSTANARASRLAQCGLVSFRLCCRSLCAADLPKRRFGKAEPTFQRVFWYPAYPGVLEAVGQRSEALAIHRAATIPSRQMRSEGERRTPAHVRRALQRTKMSHNSMDQVARHCHKRDRCRMSSIIQNGETYHGISIGGRGVFTSDEFGRRTYAGQCRGGYACGLGVLTYSDGTKKYAEHGRDGEYDGRYLDRPAYGTTFYRLFERGDLKADAHVYAGGRCTYNYVVCAPDDPRLLALITQVAPVEVRPAAPAFRPAIAPLCPDGSAGSFCTRRRSHPPRPPRCIPTPHAVPDGRATQSIQQP